MGILDGILDAFYGVFNAIFGGFFPPQEEATAINGIYTEYILGVILVGLMVSAFITIVNYFLVDHEEMKRIRQLSSEYRSKVLDAQRRGNKKEIRKLELQKKRMNELNAKMTSMSFKPMLLTMPLILVFFAWFRQTGAYGVPILEMPFAFFDLPVIGTVLGFFHGDMAANHLGAFGLYILTNFAFGQSLRKVLNMV
jgi:uncharacterized membrane protein (DUF106 family)